MKRLLVPVVLILAACTLGAPPPAQPSVAPTASDVAEPSERPVMRDVPAEEAAIKAAKNHGFVPGQFFPDRSARVDCIIHGGGPPPGIQVPGSCETSAVTDRASGSITVTFTEYWDGREFHLAGEPGTGELSHSWVFVVDGAGRATLIASTGHFPPQLVK